MGDYPALSVRFLPFTGQLAVLCRMATGAGRGCRNGQENLTGKS
jgi:hypothetical protein